MHLATIDLPVAKRMKLIGTGGHRIRSLIDDTGEELVSFVLVCGLQVKLMTWW